jgi:uncharacterized RDD family membrane protein YckC
MPVSPREHAEIERKLWGKIPPSGMSVYGHGYAGFWLRVIASIIDAIIIAIVLITIMSITGKSVHMQGYGWAFNGNEGAVRVVFNWLYFTLLESSGWRATVGKRLMGLEVIDLEGNRIGFGRANARYWSKILSTIILFIGFFMVAFTEKKQGLHDMIAKTLVIKR